MLDLAYCNLEAINAMVVLKNTLDEEYHPITYLGDHVNANSCLEHSYFVAFGDLAYCSNFKMVVSLTLILIFIF